MDVIKATRSYGPIVGLILALSTGAPVQADPIYTVVDLGAGPVSYGRDSSGDSTVTGSSGQTYVFNPGRISCRPSGPARPRACRPRFPRPFTARIPTGTPTTRTATRPSLP